MKDILLPGPLNFMPYQCVPSGTVPLYLRLSLSLLQVPVKPTIKEVDANLNVVKTLQRSKLWEVQTPQVIRPSLLREGFDLVKKKGLEVTDDVR